MPETIPEFERNLSLLSGMARLLQCCPDEDDLLDVLYWYLPLLFAQSSGELFLDHDDNQDFVRVFSWGEAEGPLPAAPCTALTERLPSSCIRTAQSVQCRTCAPGSVCMPLIAGRRPIGVLRFATPGDGVMQGIGLRFIAAEHIALAVANIRLRVRLRELAMRDQLTGLYNRRFLNEALDRELGRAARLGVSLGLIMFDLDHFKLINDTHGHDAGDAVLATVAALLRENLRTEDVACRFGGEEFLLLLCGSSYEDTMRRADDIRRAVEALHMQFNGRDIGPVSISAGVSAHPCNAQSAAELIHAADQALLRAKKAGRNTIVGQDCPL